MRAPMRSIEDVDVVRFVGTIVVEDFTSGLLAGLNERDRTVFHETRRTDGYAISPVEDPESLRILDIIVDSQAKLDGQCEQPCFLRWL